MTIIKRVWWSLFKKDKKGQKVKDKYLPDLYYSCIWKIDFSMLSQKGIKYLIIDVDSTIAHKDSNQVDARAKAVLLKVLNEGTIKNACLVSNTIHGKRREQRIAAMAKELNDIPYVAALFLEQKPYPKPFLKGLKLMNATPEETAVIGDQIFTDIQGGNRLGMFTVLVDPLGPVHWTTILLLRRMREKRIIKKMGLVPLDHKPHEEKQE